MNTRIFLVKASPAHLRPTKGSSPAWEAIRQEFPNAVGTGKTPGEALDCILNASTQYNQICEEKGWEENPVTEQIDITLLHAPDVDQSVLDVWYGNLMHITG